MAVNVRQATVEDASQVAALIRELASSMGEATPVTGGYVRAYMAFPGSKILLAEEDARAVGLLSYSVRPGLFHGGDSALIEELVVTESHRGKGVGSALLTALLKQLEEEGCAEVSVSTMPDNAGVLRFYKSHGLVDEAVYLEKHFSRR